MKSIKTVVALLAFVGFSSAQAQELVKSEQFWQAEPTTNNLTPALNYVSSKATPKTGNETTTTGPDLGVAYEYGITENFAAGLALGYLSQTQEVGTTETDTTGLQDLDVFFKGRHAFVEGSSFHWGAHLTASLQDAEIDEDGNESAQSGGMALTPYVGYAWAVGSDTAGARLAYDLYQGDRTVNDKRTDTENEIEGGETMVLSGFYELNFEGGLVGFEPRYITIGEIETDGTLTGGDYQTLGLRVYPRFDLSETMTIIGDLSYDFLMSDEIGGQEVDSGDAFNIGVAGRFTF